MNSVQRDCQDEEEFVLLDLSSVSGELDIPANAPYVLSVCSKPAIHISLGLIKLSLKKKKKKINTQSHTPRKHGHFI